MEKVSIKLKLDDLRIVYYSVQKEIEYLENRSKLYPNEATTKRIKELKKLKKKVNEKQEQLERFFADKHS